MTESNELTARNRGHIRASMKPGALHEAMEALFGDGFN